MPAGAAQYRAGRIVWSKLTRRTEKQRRLAELIERGGQPKNHRLAPRAGLDRSHSKARQVPHTTSSLGRKRIAIGLPIIGCLKQPAYCQRR
jgi:hypothetical protein